MSANEWSLIAQAAGVAGAAVILVVVAARRFTREAVLVGIGVIAVAGGVYALVTGMHNELMGTAAVRTRWLDAQQGREKCIADASDQKWLPAVHAAEARLHEGDFYTVLGPPEVDLACLQLQLLPALGVPNADRRAHLLISFDRVPPRYRGLPQQRAGEATLLTRP